MTMALDGVKVLDLSRVLAGPYATMILGDMGADIIKIEQPGSGDDSRGFGPFQNGESAYFMSINRNKRSITLNLKHQKGQQLFCELVKQVDVVVENFRPGTMERLGLGYEKLAELNPRLIYAAISGFGRTGPYSSRPAYDGVVQAMGGIMSITGEEGGPPTRVGPSIADLSAGMYGVIGILGALVSRERTGKGQLVDVAMLDCQVSLLENAIARYVVSGKVPGPIGNRHSSITPFEPFATQDGELMLAVGNDALWQKLCQALGNQQLSEDPRFITNALRNQNYAELRPILAQIFLGKTTAEWSQLLDTAGVPSGPINTVDKLLDDPQVAARDMIVEVEHPVAGNLRMPGIPIKLSETPGSIRTAAPLLGQHTDDILQQLLGLSAEQIAKLRSEGVVE